MATVPLTTAQGKSHLSTSLPRNTPLLPLAAGTGRTLSLQLHGLAQSDRAQPHAAQKHFSASVPME